MRKNITEVIDFMERLRTEFPCDKDAFGDYVRCNVLEVADRLVIPVNEVWEYVSAASEAHLIDNNGGDLRFNNSLYEDVAEMVLLDAFHKAEQAICNIPMGFIYKVIRNMYRGENFCAGKLADFHRRNSIPIQDVMLAIGNWAKENSFKESEEVMPKSSQEKISNKQKP